MTTKSRTRNPASPLRYAVAFDRIQQLRGDRAKRRAELLADFDRKETEKETGLRERVPEDQRGLFDALMAQLPRIEQEAKEVVGRIMGASPVKRQVGE